MSDDLRDLYTSLDGLALADLVRRREVSAVEVLDTAVAAIESINPEINAVIDRTYDYGRRQIAAGLPAGPFEGVPFLLKELATLVAGLKQTNACPYLRDYVATLDMETVVRQKRAGFVIVGKTNAPENGWSLTTEPAMFGPTRNPWRSDVTPGGSSGGAGAAVAARFVPIAEASDAAGSIRVPASNNGLVGLKPSRGRMTVAPAYGDVFFGCAHFLCVSRTVRDTAAYLDAIGGVVPGDPYTAPLPEGPFLQEVTTQPDRLRIGFTRAAPDGQQLHPDAVAAVEGAASLLEEFGHNVEEHDLIFDFSTMWSVYMDIIAVQTDFAFEAAATYVGHPVRPDEVSAITWEMIERGRAVSGTAHTRDVDSLRLFGREIAASLVRVRPETLCRITEFSEHESNGRELDEGERVAVEVLPVLGQSAAAVEPGDGAFDHPTPGLDDEALHPIGSLDDLGLEIGQDAGQGAVKDRPLIGAVGEQFPEKGKQTEQGRQQRETAVAILNVGGGDDAVQQQALRIDPNMPLLALGQLAGIEAVAVDASPPFSALFTL